MADQLSIRNHLTRIVLVALVPIGLFAAVMSYFLWQSQQAQRDQEQLARVRSMAALVESKLQNSTGRLQHLASDRVFDEGSLHPIYQRLHEVLATNPEWDNLVLISREAQVLNTQLPLDAALPKSGDRPYQQQAFATLKPTVSDLFQARVRRGEGIDVAVPVIRDGKATYLLLASLRLDVLSADLRPSVPDGGVATVVDRNLRIVARTREPDAYIGQSPSATMTRIMGGGPEGVLRTTTREGVRVFTTWTTLANGWAIATGTPTAAADRAIMQSIVLFGVAWVVMLALVLGMARLLWRRIDRSIRTTVDVATELAAGRPNPFPPTTVKELSGLVRAIENLFTRERQARAEAEASSKAKDEFLAMLGHELRNPIAAISNASYILQRSSGADDSGEVFARRVIARQAEILKRLIDDLLDVGRVLTGKITLDVRRIELSRCVNNALEAIRASGRMARHRIEFESEAVWVNGDQTRMEQIVTNLVVNAIGHTPADGRIDISVGRDGSAAIVRVTDTGSGIAPESLPKVFDLFFQEAQRLDRPRSGLGIGLTLVQRLAQLHGGSVVAASDGVGHGATFTVRLPACAADMQPSGERAATAHPDARRIMIVEDNADARETLRLTLELDGHEVATAADGHAALEQLRTFAADVVIIDIGLPQMDGYVLGRAIRAALGNSLTLIALTGYGLPDDVRKALEAGFNDHLTKPADLNRLGALLAGTRGARPPLRAPGIAG